MSITTLFQEADRKRNQYGVVANATFEDILYIPYDDVGTKRLTVLTHEINYSAPSSVSPAGRAPMDFIVDNAIAAGNPRSIQLDAHTLNHKLHSQGTSKSIVMVHAANSAIGPTFVNLVLGAEAAAASKLTLSGGVATVDFTDAIQDDASATSQLSGAGTYILALVLDRENDTLALYEADAGSDLSLTNSVAATNGSATAVQFDDPTTLLINSAIASDTYGTLFLGTDGGVALPSGIVQSVSDLANNWINGMPGLGSLLL